MGLFKNAVLVGLLAVGFRTAYHLTRAFDYFNTIYNHEPGNCRLIPGIQYGAEDFEYLDNGIVLATAGVDMMMEHPEIRNGDIVMMDVNNESPKFVSVVPKGFDSKGLNPHGLSTWKIQAGKYLAYIIDHNFDKMPQERVIVFEVDTKAQKLTYVRTITDDSFVSLNDVSIVEKDKFYFTNDLHSKKLAPLELNLGIPSGQVGYYDGKSGKIVSRGLMMANGLMVSNDRKTLYVADGMRKAMRIFKINGDRSVTQTDEFYLGSLVDNITVDSDDNIYVALHPHGLKLFTKLMLPKNVAPSQVVKLKLDKNGKIIEAREVYSNDGSQLQVSSTAVRVDNKLLIGSLNDKFLMCSCNNSACE